MATLRKATLPLIVAILPSLLFFFLTIMTSPRWPGIDRTLFGHLILSMAIALPLFISCATCIQGGKSQLLAIFFAALSSVLLCFHAGIDKLIVRDIDEGQFPSIYTLNSILGIFIGALSIPLGLAVVFRRGALRKRYYVLVTVLFGASGQIVWFLLTRWWLGTGGTGHARAWIPGALCRKSAA